MPRESINQQPNRSTANPNATTTTLPKNHQKTTTTTTITTTTIRTLPSCTATTIANVIQTPKLLMVVSMLVLTLWIDGAELKTIVNKPTSGVGTLIPGQPLYFECDQVGRQDAEFKWYKKPLVEESEATAAGASQPILLEPNTDDNIEIHNRRLTLLKPNYQDVGDYICQALGVDRNEDPNELAVIKVRAQPYIDDFGVDSVSHTGKSATITDGDRLELTCHARDPTVPVNITWLRSEKSEEDRYMIELPESQPQQQSNGGGGGGGDQGDQIGAAGMSLSAPTFTSASNVVVERVDNFTKRLIIAQVGPEHRGHYVCLVDNGVTEKSRKTIFIRVKDKIVALWPFLGILAELFILFTIIYVWETQRAQKALTSAKGGAAGPAGSANSASKSATGGKRQASGPTSAFENVPLNR